MRKLIFIIFLFSIAQAKPNKAQKIKNLENALRACISNKEVLSDTLYMEIHKEPTRKEMKAEIKCNKVKSKHEVQKAKIEAKKAIVLAKKEVKTNKTEQKQKTKRNFFFQFFQTIRTFIGSLTMGQIFGGGAGAAGALTTAGLFFKKYKPLSRIFGFLNKK